MIKIGKFKIYQYGNGDIWIDWDGEGGEFSAADLEKVIDKFYGENF